MWSTLPVHLMMQDLPLEGPLVKRGDSHAAGASVRATTSQPPPKVALLFLTRGPMPLESIWATFLGPSSPWQQLFSVFVHAPPGHTYAADSMFHNRQIADPVAGVSWGQHSLVGCPCV